MTPEEYQQLQLHQAQIQQRPQRKKYFFDRNMRQDFFFREDPFSSDNQPFMNTNRKKNRNFIEDPNPFNL